MDIENIQQELEKRFKKDPKEFYKRRIIFWYDEEKEFFRITMRGCPSKGMLLKMGYTNPYDKYCKHCDILYSHCAKKYGIEITNDDRECDKAKCELTARPFKGDK